MADIEISVSAPIITLPDELPRVSLSTDTPEILVTVPEPAELTLTPHINLKPDVGFVSNAEKMLEETKEVVASVVQEVIQKPTFLEFPNVGDERFLYVDQDTNKSFRWDGIDLKYYCVGSNYEDIKLVDGGGANNE